MASAKCRRSPQLRRFGPGYKVAIVIVIDNTSIRTHGRESEHNVLPNPLSMFTYNGNGPFSRPLECAIKRDVIVGWYTRTGVYLTGFVGTALGTSSIAGGASLSGRGALTGGARGFCLGSEESAGTRVRLDLEAIDNDKSYLFSSASPSFWLRPFSLTVRLLDWVARPTSGDGLICGLDCRNGSRNPWLTSFCGPDVLRVGGKGIQKTMTYQDH
ncbi:hypothetical protein BJ912DRAFT_176528 [Pholiota molesta]|nr:hypothetical protein BJ912DRAFT_176528 [Pholiota molesta]